MYIWYIYTYLDILYVSLLQPAVSKPKQLYHNLCAVSHNRRWFQLRLGQSHVPSCSGFMVKSEVNRCNP